MPLCPVSGGGLDMKRRATKALQDKHLAGILGGQARGIEQIPDARAARISMLANPHSETTPPSGVGPIKHGLMADPNG
jgi:hypothetical protein